MSDTMQSILAILIIIVFFAVTRMAVAWRYRRTAIKMVNELKEKGAEDESRAVELPYAKKEWHQFGLRDYRGKTLEGLLSNGIIGVTGDGRYYLRQGG
jgi:ABC-type transport system involved in cytochrome bd biosynthesis fused ATPase/permease subunit